MQYKIIYDSPGRLRLCCGGMKPFLKQEDEYAFLN